MTYTVHHADCLVALRMMADDSIDAIVTDPPYGLAFMGKRWDYDVPSVDVWREALRVLKPGGHLLAFGGTRTYHRMAVAIEDGGFEIRDQIQWIYGSGFPKSHNLDGEWDGWGTALKPANEPICLARKPLAGTVAENVLAWGTGAINVDGCRVGTDDILSFGSRELGDGIKYNKCKPTTEGVPHASGRWPANVVHDGSDEVVGLFPARAGAQGGKDDRGRTHVAFSMDSPRQAARKDTWGEPRDELGSAARFFYCAKASKAERDAGLDGLAEKPAGALKSGDGGWRNEENRGRKARHDSQLVARNHHPTVKPVALMRWLVRLVTPPGGVVLDPFCGSGSTGVACMAEGLRFVGIEREAEYVEIAKLRIGNAVAEQAFGLFAEAAD